MARTAICWSTGVDGARPRLGWGRTSCGPHPRLGLVPLAPVTESFRRCSWAVPALGWIVVLAIVGAAPLTGCGADREEDEQQNLAILHELPTFPGARELEVSTAAYYGDEEGPFDAAEGHTTTITYGAPGGATQRELIRFYRSRLEEDWECDVERSEVIGNTDAQHPRAYLVLQCSSATASISVNPDNLTTRKSSFDVVADHRGSSG
jgi:hypothetical protein